jgi:flagellar motor switch/type III secretory pathway protein FliN
VSGKASRSPGAGPLPELDPLPTGEGPLLGPDDVRDLPIHIEVHLGRTGIDLGSLRVGAVLVTDQRRSDPLPVLISDVPVAEGVIRTRSGRLTLHVTGLRAAAQVAESVWSETGH